MFEMIELRRRLKQGDAKKSDMQPLSRIANVENPPELSTSDGVEAIRNEKLFYATLQTMFDLIHS
jgi:hypothetical protein